MTGTAGTHRETAALRERLDALTAAILRVSESLDVDTVTRESAEAARALTGARYAVITVVDADGALEDFVVSGFTPAEEKRVFDWTDNLRVFERMRHLSGTLRVADMPAYVEGLGFSTDGVIINTFLGTSMRHRGALIGHFFLGEKRTAEEFSDADEEVLALFAAQAAAAIANARAHRAERRARANLEALVETSPVGVIVFDAPGRSQSMNREARRLIDRLRADDGPSGALPEAAVCRFTDGRVIALDALGDALLSASAVRAEEVEVSVPNGRSVRRARQHNPDPRRGRGGHLGRRHPAGPGADPGAGAAARRLSRHSEPRTARAAGGDPGLGSHPA